MTPYRSRFSPSYVSRETLCFSRPVRLSLGIGLLVCFALAGAGCAGVSSPDGWASPAQNEDVLLASDHDRVTAFSSVSLEEAWRFPAPDADIRTPAALYGTPAIADGSAYIPTYDREDRGSIHKLNLENGEVLWTFEHDTPILGSVAASADGIFFGDNDGRVFSLDPATGEEIWSFKTGDRVWSTPTVAGDTLLVTSLDGRLYALDLASGDERWRSSTSAGIAASPVVDEAAGLVFIAGLDSHVRAIDLDSGAKRWSFKGGNAIWATPLLSGGVIYAADSDGNVYALNVDDGEPRWDKPFQTKDPIRSAAVEVGGSIFVVDREGHVYELDPADGSSRGEIAIAAKVLADPLVLQDVLILVTTGGDLIQLNTDQLAEIGRKRLR